MYLTKEQVEEMIARALANGGVVGDSALDRRIESLSTAVKGSIDAVVAGFEATKEIIAHHEERIAKVEGDLGDVSKTTVAQAAAAGASIPAPDMAAMEMADDPGAVIAHPEPEAAPAPAEPAQG